MALVNDLRAVALRARAIPGQLGLRPHRVWLCRSSWSGQRHGAGTESSVEAELVEGDGQPPKVTWLDSEALAVGGYPAGSLEVGNLTPGFAAGGVDFSDLIGKTLSNGEALFVRVTGPRHPDGARYRVKEARHKSALSYSIVCVPEV